jgi:YD repeat-containing protein
MKNFGITSEKALDLLKGDVKTVTIKTYSIKDGKRELMIHSIDEYNHDGYKCLFLDFQTNGMLELRKVFRFDKNGNKIGYINYDASNFRDSYGEYRLDWKGRIVSKSHNGEIEEAYEYNANSQISVVHYPTIGARDIYEYDKNGLAINQLSLRDEGSLFSSYFDEPNKKLTIFENDHWGNIVMMLVYDAETKKLLFTQKNKFNKHGDEIESIEFNEDGSVYGHIKYDYEYDEKGNWIIRRALTKEAHVYEEFIRTIIYYNQNL